MQRTRIAAYVATVAFALLVGTPDTYAQGKGGGKGQGGKGGNPHAGPPGNPGKGNAGGQGQGKGAKGPEKVRGNPGAARSERSIEKSERSAGRSVGNNAKAVGRGRAHAVLATAAIASASNRGHGNDFRVSDVGDRVMIANRNGTPLLYLDENDARDLGKWRVGLLDDQVRGGAPSFCRSGAGHPVWGRQWCIDKGFGLGDYEDYRWGRTTDLGDWSYRRGVYEPSVTGAILQTLLGPTAYNRLALHAVELGFLEPLTGRWVSQQTGPQVLLVNSGAYPVAEVVDTNRDFRWDDLLVALLLNR